MSRMILAILSLSAAIAAQDLVFPVGYGSSAGPPANGYPAFRAKDQNRNGTIETEEIYAFVTTLPTTASSGINFMTDGRWVRENGNPVFYLTDSEDGQILRCEDANHSGVIEPGEVIQYFHFGLSSSSGSLRSPDSVAVYHDDVLGETRVYASLDNGSASGLGYTKGIHRLVDNNGDGDAMDPGEHSMFVDSSMNLTVTGRSGPVTISRDYWSRLRVLPGGKLIAYANGLPIDGVLVPNSNPPVYTYTAPPEMNCWYGFTDNNGTAVPEIWFNVSTLNDLPVHPDFDDPSVPSTSLWPNWDVQDATAVSPPTRVNYARYCDVVAGGGPGGEDVYYLASSYRKTSEGDSNLNGQPVSGLVYRVVDANANQVIDSGEISLYLNLSGATHNGIPPIDYIDENLQPVAGLDSIARGYSTSTTGSVNFVFQDNWVLTLDDVNQSGAIDQGEAYVPFVVPPYAPGLPFGQNFTPYHTSMVAMGEFEMPGPFGLGVEAIGDSCFGSHGKKPVMEMWNGYPQIGNQALEIGCIRAFPNQVGFLMFDLVLAPAPLNLTQFGLPAGCNSYLRYPVQLAVTIGDADGVHFLNTQLPNAPGLVGVPMAFQFALADPAATTAVPYVVTNALSWVIQS